MSTLLPKLRAKYGEGVGAELLFSFPELQDDVKSYLDADAAAGVTSLSANGTDFAVGQYVVIGQPGNEKTEICQISTGTPPTATTITLQAATSFAHNRGDIIRFIPYNQIVPSFSSNAGVSYTAASAIAIRADASETYLQRPSDTAAYLYTFQFFNSYLSVYSPASDAASPGGYADNTQFGAIYRALDQMGESFDANLITRQFMVDSLKEGRRVADMNPNVFRWTFRQKFGVVFSQILAGQWSIPAPADIRDPNTYKNVLSIRIGNQNRPVVYQEQKRWNQNYLNIGHTTVATQAIANATSIVLASTHDLDAAGTVTLANNNVGDGLIAISYTGNNKATNTLTGVTGINRTVLVGTDVWQRPVFGLPTGYTIFEGNIYFDVPLKIDYDGMDVKGDYYAAMKAMTQDTDTFDEDFYDLYTAYLKWKIKYKKANGKIDRDGDTDYKDFISGLVSLVAQQTGGQRLYFVPDIEGFLSATE